MKLASISLVIVLVIASAFGCLDKEPARINRAEWFLRAQLGSGVDAACNDAFVGSGDYATCLIAIGSAHVPVEIVWCSAPTSDKPQCVVAQDMRPKSARQVGGSGSASP